MCVVDATGRIVREARVASEPEALVAWFRGLGIDVTRVGLEAGPLSMPYAQMKSNLMDSDSYEPGFAVANALKDLHLAADSHAPSPLLAEVAARLARTVEDGHGEADVAAVHRTR